MSNENLWTQPYSIPEPFASQAGTQGHFATPKDNELSSKNLYNLKRYGCDFYKSALALNCNLKVVKTFRFSLFNVMLYGIL